MKKILLLINQMSDHPTEDEMDVLVQAEAVEKALDELGFTHQREYFSLDLNRTRIILQKIAPDIVFNLVESVDGKGALIHLCTSLLEAYGIPFTGSGTFSLIVTTDKARAKNILADNKIPTPGWIIPGVDFEKPVPDKQYIIKPVWEDGSTGITDESIVTGKILENKKLLADLKKKGYFLETFIPGREFNLSVVSGKEGPVVLPAAEMQYLDYPAGKPKILNYASKWDSGSFEYQKTIRTFEIPDRDKNLIGKMSYLSKQCWDVFEINGYMRVDFRVDDQDNPFVLEVNANPCLSPDAGFAASCAAGGINFTAMVERIVNDARI